MSSYKLMYFDGRGKAEVARLMFKLKQVEFKDIRITHEEWPKHKAGELDFFHFLGSEDAALKKALPNDEKTYMCLYVSDTEC